jgi:hypothetical protein
MNKEFKGYKEGCRYLVKDDSKFWDTSLVEIYVLEISEKAIKIKFDNGDAKWYLKETFNFSMIENLSEVKVVKQIIKDRSYDIQFEDDVEVGNLRLE